MTDNDHVANIQHQADRLQAAIDEAIDGGLTVMMRPDSEDQSKLVYQIARIHGGSLRTSKLRG